MPALIDTQPSTRRVKHVHATSVTSGMELPVQLLVSCQNQSWWAAHMQRASNTGAEVSIMLMLPSQVVVSVHVRPGRKGLGFYMSLYVLQGRKVVKRRRSQSPDPPEATPPGVPPAQLSSPSAFPELLGSAKRFAVTSPRAKKLNSASPYQPMLGKPASPTIQQLFSRQAAGQSPAGAQTSPASASAPVKSASANPAVADIAKPVELTTSVKGRKSAGAATAVQERCPEEQRDRSLAKQAVGILSEVVNSSASGRAAQLRSIRSAERAGRSRLSGANAVDQSSSPISPDESCGVQQMSGPDEQAMDITSPVGARDRSGSLSRSTDLHGGQSGHGARFRQAWRRQEEKAARKGFGRAHASVAAAEVINLLD